MRLGVLAGDSRVVCAAPGADGLWLGALWERVCAQDRGLLVVARDNARVHTLVAQLRFMGVPCEALVAWDCLPYDRVGPTNDIATARLETLSALRPGHAQCVVVAVPAFVQKIPDPGVFRLQSLGPQTTFSGLQSALNDLGYRRCDKVFSSGEYAVRGGLLDCFPVGASSPLRVDFFGEELTGIRTFDPLSQRTQARLEGSTFPLAPACEVLLSPEGMKRFCTGYRKLFGASSEQDALYQAVRAGAPESCEVAIEHWMGLFYERLSTLPELYPEAVVVLDDGYDAALEAHRELVQTCYDARCAEEAGTRALPPEMVEAAPDLTGRSVLRLQRFRHSEGEAAMVVEAQRVEDFALVRQDSQRSLAEAVRLRFEAERPRRVGVAVASESGQRKMEAFLSTAEVEGVCSVNTWAEWAALPLGSVALIRGGMSGFRTAESVLYTEQDIWGVQRPVRSGRSVRPVHQSGESSERRLIEEYSTLSPGDLVVHIEHGIGRYEGLETLTIYGAPHDCLKLTYAGDDRLYLPVENVDMLSRYGSGEDGRGLDRLGAASWQDRKARVRKRLQALAESLLALAARRALKEDSGLDLDNDLYRQFTDGFAYQETEDQSRAIRDVLEDLSQAQPMDRLVCGDVGFGKTEVALRAAFMVALAGKQTLLVCPTTVLAQQHFETFKARFAGFPVRLGRLSRLVLGREAAQTREGLAEGTMDIVIGTQALLSRRVQVQRPGLVIIDEEQRFGVQQKERLKALRDDVHVLSLSATPIPRTLQMALSGLRSLSLIATPPLDRRAVSTFITPFDPMVIAEAIKKERFRGGQVFYVCPRISDLQGVQEQMLTWLPDVTVGVAHSRLPAAELERVMGQFVRGELLVLLCTNIVESGLDIPRANTLIVYGADRFGLAQLYQLRGRIGRGAVSGKCYLTYRSHLVPGDKALRRLQIIETLDGLGAGFALASHDMEMRGAGDLLGEQQSGHVREVGVELYQKMLEEAVEKVRQHEADEHESAGVGRVRDFSPQINLGVSVMIPEDYVPDLPVRMSLYRRCGALGSLEAIEAFAEELRDRFGPHPEPVGHLIRTLELQHGCRRAWISRVDVGEQGVSFAFHQQRFPNPEGLVDFIEKNAGRLSLNAEHKLVYRRRWQDASSCYEGVRKLVLALGRIAQPWLGRAA